MKQYNVTGMSCAACVARVEKEVNKVPGVTACSVSLLTNSMGVEGEATASEIIKAVENAGYEATEKNNDNDVHHNNSLSESKSGDDVLADKETPILIKRLLWSGIFTLILMYFSMGHAMLGLDVPELLEQNPVAMAVLQMILAALVMIINQKFFISGFKSAMHLAPNMDTLVALGSFVSFAYSIGTMYMMMAAQLENGIAAADAYMNSLFFESAAMILTLITVGKTLEARSKGRTTDALKSLMRLSPKRATVIREEQQIEVSIEQVQVDDIFIVKPGENIPVDGIIIEGSSAVNEASLTGESIPVDKEIGDEVSAATINQSGYLKCRATRVGKDTTLSQIIDMVSNAAATKAPIAKVADKVAGIFVPCVLAIALITFIIWLLVGQTVGTALSFAISILVISCPCSLGLATPVAIMVGNGVGAKNGILYKTAASLENSGRIQIAVFDKTGTITKGDPQVTDIYPANEESEKSLLSKAYALEAKSEHPLAKAIVKKAEEEKIQLLETTQMTAVPGKGLSAMIDDKWIYGGNEVYIRDILCKNTDKNSCNKDCKQVDINQTLKMNSDRNSREYGKNKININDCSYNILSSEIDDIKNMLKELSSHGKTPLLFAQEDKLLGIIAVSDVIKDDAKAAIDEIKRMGIRVVMLTGDNALTAKAIAKQVGVEHVVSEVLPDGKEAVISKLKQSGKVAMIGDGINDAPALTSADIGIAIGSGTDVAIDAAEVVLMKNDLKYVSAAIRLGRATLKNIKENLFWAFFYNSVAIPVAAGALVTTLGLKLNPMIGALAMSLSSFCVVTNALRLNLLKVFDVSHDKLIKHTASKLYLELEENINIQSEIATDRNDISDQSHNKNDILVSNEQNKTMEETTMTKTMKIEGMMCMHCEARVKKTLEAIAGVESAEVSHEKGTAVVTIADNVDVDTLTSAVDEQGYKVLSVD